MTWLWCSLALSRSTLWAVGLTSLGTVRGRPRCEIPTSWKVDDGDWSSLPRQDSREEASIGLLDKLWSKSNNRVPSSPGLFTLRDWRWGDIYSSLGLLIRYISVLLFQPLITWFPCGSDTMESFPGDSVFPKDQVRSQGNPASIGFQWTNLPEPYPNSDWKYFKSALENWNLQILTRGRDTGPDIYIKLLFFFNKGEN